MNKTVLLVDDSALVRKVLSFQLKGAGYTILTGVDGDDALSHFDGKDIDLVITDLNMPNKNGFQLISEIGLRITTGLCRLYYSFRMIVSKSAKPLKTRGQPSILIKMTSKKSLYPL